MKSFAAHASKINRIKQSPFSADFVASCSDYSTVKIWNATTATNSDWNLIRTYTGHTNPVYGLEWIDQDTIASGSNNKEIQLWSRITGLTIRTINTDSEVYCLKMLLNGVHLASGLGNSQIKIYDKNDGSLFRTLTGHSGLINNLALTNNGNLLASSSADSKVCIWDLTTTNPLKFTLTGHGSPVYGLKMISNDILASGSEDNSIKLWNIANGNQIRALPNTNKIYWSVDLLNDAVTLVSGSAGQKIELWNVNNGSLLRSIDTGMLIRTLTILNITAASTSNYYWFILRNLIKSIKDEQQ
jgi:WD40 repeat protein